MAPHQVVALLVRLFVIWIACIFLIRIPNTYAFYQQDGISTFPMMVILGIVFVILALIWNFPVFVSKRIISNSIVQETKSSSYESWLEIGIIAMGLWLLVQAISPIVQYATLYVYSQHVPLEGGMSDTWNANLVGNIVQVILSFTMLLNGPAIEKIVRRLRGR
jgi:uncharacterized membrane protein